MPARTSAWISITPCVHRIEEIAPACPQCPATAEPETEIRFAAPGSLTVAIEGYLGSPYHGRLRALLEPERGSTVGGGTAWAEYPPLDRDGRAVFSAVQPGNYELVLTLGRTGRSVLPVSRTPVSVAAGAAEAKVAIPPLHPVRIRATRWVQVRRQDDPSWRVATDQPDAEGLIVLDGLPAGDYAISRGRDELSFSVPTTGEIVVKE